MSSETIGLAGPPGAPSAYPGRPAGPPGFGGTGGQRATDRAPILLRAVAAAVVFAAIAGAVYMVTQGTRRYPKNWDSRVADLVEFVEATRGHHFDHPVRVNFLTAAEYSKHARGDASDPDEDTLVGRADDEATFRALGFIDGSTNLNEAIKTMSDSGSLAFYSPDARQIYVRGTEMSPALKVTLVHELTHALQDQVFDLGRMSDLADNEASTLRSLAEGDATRIENAYVDKMSDADRKAYREESSSAYLDASDSLSTVPQAVQAIFQAPYIFGPEVVEQAAATDGGNNNAAVDALFEQLPSEFAVFDPTDFNPADHPASKQDVIKIPLPEGAKSIDEATFSPAMWYLLLANRMDPQRALAATDLITGDGFHSYKTDDRVCVLGAAHTENAEDAGVLTSALKDWAKASPGTDAEVTAKGTAVQLRTCDPANDGAEPTVQAKDLMLPATRSQGLTVALQGGADRETAACFADEIIKGATIEDVTTQISVERQDEAAAACR